MSEYQYYEFQAVDRPLDQRQISELRALSTRATITPTSFVNSYHWGDFRGNPQVLMERYFDAFLYLANWGTRQLMLRLPTRLLDLETAERYCVGEPASVRVRADHLVLDLGSEADEESWEEDAERSLASIVGVRTELAAGDLRGLYLAWLLWVQAEELVGDELEPPVPAGLGELSGSLRALADFLRIDEDLIAVAAEASGPPGADEGPEGELAGWIAGLSAKEKNALLLRVVHGHEVQVGAELMRRFRKPAGRALGDGRRTAGELLDAAEARRTERERLAEERRVQERQRRERASVIAREQRLDGLASRQEQAWTEVSAMIDTKKPGEYDAAVVLLKDLQALAAREGSGAEFGKRFLELRGHHLRKPSLIERFDRAGLTPAYL